MIEIDPHRAPAAIYFAAIGDPHQKHRNAERRCRGDEPSQRDGYQFRQTDLVQPIPVGMEKQCCGVSETGDYQRRSNDGIRPRTTPAARRSITNQIDHEQSVPNLADTPGGSR